MPPTQNSPKIDGAGRRAEHALTEGLGDTLLAEVFNSSSRSHPQPPNYAQRLPEAAAVL